MKKIIINKKFVETKPKLANTTLSKMLTYAGIAEPPQLWLGSRILTALIIAFLFSILPIIVSYFLKIDFGFGIFPNIKIVYLIGYMIVIFVIVFFLILTLFYLHLYYLIHDTTKRVEEVLPDFLLMIAANMHAGLTPFAAFQAAARPEFGPLEREVKKVAAYSLGTESFTDALNALTENIDSDVLRRTIAFFENGLKSGGKLANLLETAAEEIRDLDELKKETVLNTKTYTIFLIFILVIGLPVLLGISTEFLAIFTKLQTGLKPTTGSSAQTIVSMISPTIGLSAEFVNSVAFALIFLTSLFVSIFIGVIAEGKLVYGIKYMPLLAIGAYAVYFVVKTLLHGFLSVFF
ncbi:MAG: type II secretion system F family protein [Candidatus Micrarchaeota archaeon]|nr:type II secretion system F family protein [Candidatus Micrarchaeota archaeon]